MEATRRIFRDGGVTYPRAFVATPLCCPSRATLFTGRYSHNHGVLSNRHAPALDHAYTIQAYLRDAGYRTAIAGKFLNRWSLEDPPPHFDRWAIGPGKYFGATFNVDGTNVVTDGYYIHFLTERAVEFIDHLDEDDDAPWFLYLAPNAPHAPFTPEAAHEDAAVGRWDGNPAVRERDRSDKTPYVQRSTRDLSTGRAIRRGQLRTLMSVDDLVSQVFDALSAAGELERTLALFVSDNGYMWGEHGLAGKKVPYTPSIRVPLLARWPGHLPSGATDRRMVSSADIAPTVLDAAGVVPPEGAPSLDGRSLLDASWSRRRALIEALGGNSRVPAWASIRSGRYQYVEYYDAEGRITFREYYNLVDDRWQLRNLLGDRRTGNDPNVRALSARLARDRACAGAEGPAACP